MTDKPTLPPPMVPPEIDLRGTAWMPLLGARLFSSDFDLEASDAEFRRGLRLWWAAWNQVPAGSLPSSERAQAKLAGFEDETSSTWKKVKKRALDGFVLCSDGRLYHPVIAEQAMLAWDKRVEAREEANNAVERQRRTRAERKRLFADLKAAGITPDFRTSMEALRSLHSEHAQPPARSPSPPPNVTEDVTPPVTVTSAPPVTPPVTPDVTRIVTVTATAIDRTEQYRTEQNTGHAPRTTEKPDHALEPVTPPSPSPGALVCIALRRAGISRVNPSNQRLAMLLEAGATVEEFVAAADKAKGMQDPFAYLLGVVEGERRQAAERLRTLHRGPMPAAETPYQRSQREQLAAMTGGLVSRRDPNAPTQPIEEPRDGPGTLAPGLA